MEEFLLRLLLRAVLLLNISSAHRCAAVCVTAHESIALFPYIAVDSNTYSPYNG